MANYALVEWPDNIEISDSAPSQYVSKVFKSRNIDNDEWIKMFTDHALPNQWEHMPYENFLSARRKLMASVIGKGYQNL